MKLELLGGISAKKFLRVYWQKKPLLIRQALPGFQGLLSRDDLIQLSCRDEAQSRLITQRKGKGQWQVQHGPFSSRTFSRLSKTQWTLLVQDVNHFLPSARDLLLKFNFIPHSRLDDLMISFAPEEGGVGPHFDSYDVFLLQGMGRRKWQISAQQDKKLVAGAPLKILEDFRPEQEWILEPGDMLYLPPGYAHDGVAKDPCMTYSIGFRAPTYQELVTQFLVYLQDHIVVNGMYRDPDMHLQPHPGHIGAWMLRRASATLDRIKWNRGDMERFMGIYLTEAKPHVFFTPPSHPVDEQDFAYQVAQAGLELNLKSRMLWRKKNIFINGEVHRVPTSSRQPLEVLADRLVLPPPQHLDSEALALLYEWYLAGYVDLLPLKGRDGEEPAI